MNAALQHNGVFQYKTLSTEDLQAFNDQGYHLCGRLLTDQGLEKMKKECVAAWEAEKEAFDDTKTWLQNSLFSNIHHQSQVVKDYYVEGPLVDMAEHIIGPNIKGVTSQLTFKMRGNTMDFGWHQDNGYGELEPYNSISCLTALDDCDEENGCLRLIPGSHKNGQQKVTGYVPKQAKSKAQAIDLEVDDTHAIPVPMKAGEVLFFNCWMLHHSRGNYSKSRDRRILFFRYADADAVEVYNNNQPRLGRLVRGTTRFPEVEAFEADL